MTWKTYSKLQLYIVILLDPHVSTAFINYMLYTCRFKCAPILSMGFTLANTLRINSVSFPIPAILINAISSFIDGFPKVIAQKKAVVK